MWGEAAGGTLVSISPSQLSAWAASLQRAWGGVGDRDHGAGPSQAAAWPAAPGRWRPFSDLGRTYAFLGFLADRAVKPQLAPLPTLEVPALQHHGKGEQTGPPCLWFPPFSQISVLKTLASGPSVLSLRYQRGLTHAQNSTMKSIMGDFVRVPHFRRGPET